MNYYSSVHHFMSIHYHKEKSYNTNFVCSLLRVLWTILCHLQTIGRPLVTHEHHLARWSECGSQSHFPVCSWVWLSAKSISEEIFSRVHIWRKFQQRADPKEFSAKSRSEGIFSKVQIRRNFQQRADLKEVSEKSISEGICNSVTVHGCGKIRQHCSWL